MEVRCQDDTMSDADYGKKQERLRFGGLVRLLSGKPNNL